MYTKRESCFIQKDLLYRTSANNNIILLMTIIIIQGIQRRLRVKLFYEADSELYWSRVNEIVIGKQ